MPKSKIPTISIIMPSYNRAHLLGRAVKSALAQTFQDWELLIIDDDSSDNTEEVVRSFQDSRIRYIKHQQNQGPAASRNTGIRAASRSKYLAYLDDDDEWLPEKLEKQLEVFRRGEPSLGIVGCGRLNHTRRGFKEVLPKVSGWVFEDVLAGRVTGAGTPLLLVKRFPPEPDFLFDEQFPALVERDYVLRITRSYQMDFVWEPLIKVYRDDGGPHVANPTGAAKAYSLLLGKYSSELKTRPLVRAYYYASMAKELCSLGRMAEVRKQLICAIKSNPWNLRFHFWFCASYFGRLGIRVCLRALPIRPPQVSRSQNPTQN